MTQPVLDIQQLHLSFPVLTVMFTRSTMCPCRLTAAKLSVWWENPAQVNQSPHVDYASATDGQLLRTSGQISLLGDDVLNAREKQLRQWRGARVAMIFQEPMTALNPTLRIGLQMMDVIRHHQPISRREARAKAIALLEEMQIRMPWKLCRAIRLSFQVVCASG